MRSESFQNLMRGINVQFQEPQVPSRKNENKPTLGDMILRISKRDNLKRNKRKRD